MIGREWSSGSFVDDISATMNLWPVDFSIFDKPDQGAVFVSTAMEASRAVMAAQLYILRGSVLQFDKRSQYIDTAILAALPQ